MKKYPIGIQSFEKIRSGNFYYVDKTEFVYNMVKEESGYYFLSRPIRFGKSLFLDTLHQAFAGRKEYFKGLFLENNWNWDEQLPVLHISFGAGIFKDSDSLNWRFNYLLSGFAEEYKVKLKGKNISDRFDELVRKISEKQNQKVVILIDEYDKPILDNIDKPESAIEIREELKNFYSVIKDLDNYLQFVFLTGVSRFSKVSIFSGLNNLKDISLDSRYSAICGYTQNELEYVFKEPLKHADLKAIKEWYNGYNFLGEPVYNPFDVLLYLDTGEFRNYWFETGTPSFLIKLIQDRKYYVPELEFFSAGDEILDSFEIDNLSLETVLFQTGYVTIKDQFKLDSEYVYMLSYPNLEVKKSLNRYILKSLSQVSISHRTKTQINIRKALAAGDLEINENFHSFFASIPHDWYRKNRISEYEGYYASIFYAYFTATGLDVTAEDTTNKGRIDLTIKCDDKIYIIEFKVIEVDKTEGTALEQIKKKYSEKHQQKGKKIYLIGIEFSKDNKNIKNFMWEKV
ncbi:MAG: ATP-binding protein [Desulfobacteraceae bacterium]|nr:ATP-binding protein [Desulfobacteraceae bacterium]MBC2719157.1 ATP-binding protein [Desulfobacteraceae bacterium]